VTNYKLFFVSSARDCPLILDVPLGFVSRVEKVGGQRTSTAENAYGLEIFCKDIRSLKFALSKSDGHPRKDIFDTVRVFLSLERQEVVRIPYTKSLASCFFCFSR